jgi:hypothetical protein
MKCKPLRVRDWIEAGELSVSAKTEKAIIEECANALDRVEATEILGGGILFRATNGRYYTITVEAVIGEASKEFVRDTLAEKR